jgi:RecA/RadA recombinase
LVDPRLFEQDLAAIKKRRAQTKSDTDLGHMGDVTIPIERIPLESPTLMHVTDGGIPIGRITRLFGSRSSGKTHLSYLVIAAAQNLCTPRFPDGLNCMYWNIEGIYDEVHARHLGVDISKLFVKPNKIIEEIAGDLEVHMRTHHLHVLDSTSSAKCVDEIAGEVDDWFIGLQAKAWKRAMNRAEIRFNGDENVIILISHMGTAIDIKRHTSHTYPKDGEYLEYISSLNLELSAGSWLFYHPDGHLEKDDKIKGETGISYSGTKEPDGVEMTVRCRKNRVGRQHRSGKMRFDLNLSRYDTTFELIEGAKFYDSDGISSVRSGNPAIAAKTSEKSSYYSLPTQEKTVQGDRGLRQAIESSLELAGMVRRAMLVGN